MMRRLIGKIISLIIQPPKTEKPQEAQDAPKEATAETPKKETKIITLDQLLGGSREALPPEPNLRVIGLYSDVNDEKIAELTQAILYLNEVNRLSDEDKKKPIEFYINTYGGSADDMFALYDVMEAVKEEIQRDQNNPMRKIFNENVETKMGFGVIISTLAFLLAM